MRPRPSVTKTARRHTHACDSYSPPDPISTLSFPSARRRVDIAYNMEYLSTQKNRWQASSFRSAPEDSGRSGTSPGQPGMKLQYLDQAEPTGVRRWNGLKDRSVDIKRAVAPM